MISACKQNVIFIRHVNAPTQHKMQFCNSTLCNIHVPTITFQLLQILCTRRNVLGFIPLWMAVLDKYNVAVQSLGATCTSEYVHNKKLGQTVTKITKSQLFHSTSTKFLLLYENKREHKFKK